MKKVLVITLIISCTFSFSQSKKKELTKDIKKYIKANNNLDYKNIAKYYPSFSSKSENKKIAKQLREFSSAKSAYKLTMDLKFKIDTIISKNGLFYARIKHGHNLVIDYTDFKESGMGSILAMTIQMQTKMYGNKNVTYKNEDWVFKIRCDKPLYAIKKEKFNWKFLLLNDWTSDDIPLEIRVHEAQSTN